jgi:hypothetical protein
MTAADPSYSRRWLGLAVVGVAQVMVVLDATVSTLRCRQPSRRCIFRTANANEPGPKSPRSGSSTSATQRSKTKRAVATTSNRAPPEDGGRGHIFQLRHVPDSGTARLPSTRSSYIPDPGLPQA